MEKNPNTTLFKQSIASNRQVTILFFLCHLPVRGFFYVLAILIDRRSVTKMIILQTIIFILLALGLVAGLKENQ